MTDIRSEVRSILGRVNFDQSIITELEAAIDTTSSRGRTVGKIIDDPTLSNEEKAAELSKMGDVGPRGVGTAIVIGIIIGLIL